MAETHHTRVLIIGSGPAGYTAAIYAARASLSPILVAGLQPGGQLTITTDVENYPGFADVIQGPWLMEQMAAQAEHVGTRIIQDLITQVDFGARPFRCEADSGDVFLADSVVIATGAQARWLGLESEQRLQGRGVSACATCDGAFFKEKAIVVVGGGDSAFEEALFLTRFGTKVTLIHRRNDFRASQIMVSRAQANPKIELLTPYAVEEVLGDMAVTGLRLRNTDTGETRDIEAQGFFVAIGHDPNTKLFVEQLDHDENGYLVTRPGSTETNVPGIFAVGDVQDHTYRQAITAAGSGCMGALDAERYLADAGAESGAAVAA